MIETSLVPPQKSLVIFGNLQKISKKCSETFVFPSEQFWKIWGNLRKVVRNLWKIVKISSLVCLYNKQYYVLTCGYEFYLLVFNSTSHLFAALICEISGRTLIIIILLLLTLHSKIKFLSTRGHVISYDMYTWWPRISARGTAIF